MQLQRKINSVGVGTLTISLPKTWVREHGLAKGQTLNIKVDSDKLVLSANPIEKRESKTIKIEDKYYMGKLVILEYTAGLDQLTITYDNPKVFEGINEELKYAPGWEIMNQTKNSCKLKILLDPKQQDLEKLLNRLFLVIISFTDEIAKAINKKDKTNWDRIREIEGTVSRLTNLSIRMLNKQIYKSNKMTNTYFGMILYLESIGDTLKYLCDTIQENKFTKFTAYALDDFNKITEFQRLVYKEFHNPDIKNIFAVRKQFKKLRKKLQALKNKKTQDVILLDYAFQITKDLDHINNLLLLRGTVKQPN